MTGDDEGSSPPKPDSPWPGSATLPGASEPDRQAAEVTSAVPAEQASGHEHAASIGGGHSADRDHRRETSPPTFNAVTGALGIAVLLLLAAVAYLFSVMPQAERLSDDEKALNDLRAQVVAVDKRATAPDLAPLNHRLDAADKELAGLKAGFAALQQPAPQAPAPQPDPGPQLAALAGQVADLQRGLDTARSAADALGKRVDGLESGVADLGRKIGDVPKVDLGPVTARIDGLESQLKPLVAEAEAAKSPDRVTEVRQNGSGAETRAAPLAVTAQAILRAIDAGKPFPDDLKALRNLGAEAGMVQPLTAVAEAGAPTTENLRADLVALRDKIVAQGAPAPSGSYLDRLMAGASSVVSVRPVGSVPGDTPPALVARMDEELGRDDLGAALADWQKLPDASRNASKGLADRIRLRQDAQNAARSIAGGAIKAMAAQP